jgi:hypothetical protein
MRLTVSQSLRLGVEPHVGLMARYLVLFDSYGLVFFCGAPSLTRGRVCLLSESLPALVSHYNVKDVYIYSIYRAFNQQLSLSLSLSLMLRPTVSRSVCLGIKHPSGACDQILISVRNTEYV